MMKKLKSKEPVKKQTPAALLKNTNDPPAALKNTNENEEDVTFLPKVQPTLIKDDVDIALSKVVIPKIEDYLAQPL